MKKTVKAWMLIEMLGSEDHAINETIFWDIKDAAKEKLNWSSRWDVNKEIVPCTITYELPEP